jgi:hypothetical protein
MMFLLNLEIAYCMPPLGLNLFISSFRFERPLASLYRVVLPFTGILAFGLALVMYVPKIATVLIDSDIERAYAEAEKNKEQPREAWLLQCVQEDRSNPTPCVEILQKVLDKTRFGAHGAAAPPDGAKPGEGSDDMDDLMKQMMGGGTGAADDKGGDDDMDDLMKQMMGAGSDAGAPAKPAATGDEDDELMKEMMK